MVMRTAILAAVLLTVAGCSSPSAATGRPVEGPSAQQLAHGRWLRMPTAPMGLCDPRAVWDGRDLVVVELRDRWCPARAAVYDPKGNRWVKIAAPPRVIGQQPVTAWGGGRLLLVAPDTGATVTWTPATGRWQQIAPVPSRDAVSAAWTGSKFLVITTTVIRANTGTAHAFTLTGGRWTRLPDLPRPGRGRIVEAVAAAARGAVYVLADINVAHDYPTHSYNSGSVELLHLAPAAWTPVPLSPGAPGSQLALTTLSGAILAAGSGCPGLGMCTLEDGTAALLRPGARPVTVALRPKAGVPYPQDIAAGGHAVVVTYPDGLGDPFPPGAGPVLGSSAIYDIATRRWLPGPTAPVVAASSRRVLDSLRGHIPRLAQARHRRLAIAAGLTPCPVCARHVPDRTAGHAPSRSLADSLTSRSSAKEQAARGTEGAQVSHSGQSTGRRARLVRSELAGFP